MTATHADQLIDDYLGRLRVAAADLPSSVRDELIEDMRAHIAEARTREPQETDATILNILDRLGEPDTVVAEASRRADDSDPHSPGVQPGPYVPGPLEIAALILLLFLWPVGVILLWISPAWKVRDKVIGTLLPPGGYPAIFIVGLLAAATVSSRQTSGGSICTSSETVGNIIQNVCTNPSVPTGPSGLEMIANVAWVILVIVLWLLPLITVGYLAMRVRWGRRARAAATA
jgi:uncharacterized membrane protein